MKSFAAFLVLLAAVSCAHQPAKPPPPSPGAYPHGVYQHKVLIKIHQPSRTFDMKGVVKYTADQLNVVGLSSFGTTVFRISENFKTGEIRKDFYLEVIQQNSERFEYFYFLIRELLLAPKGVARFEKRGARFSLSRPDELGIYRLAHIEHPQFDLDIEVTGYAF